MSASPHGTDGHDLDMDVPETDVGEGDIPEPDGTGTGPPVEPPGGAEGVGRSSYGQVQPLRGRWLADALGARARLITALLAGSLAYVIVDIFVQGPLTRLDIVLLRWDGEAQHPAFSDAAWAYDKLGQRSVLVPILLGVAGVFARRHATWRPVVLAMVSFVGLNVVVGAMKIIIGRAETETGSPDVLAGGVIFPSGHSSNMVLTGGLIIYLFWRYAEDPPLRRLTVVIAILTSLTILTSLYIGSHWLSDLIGGVLVGGLLLQLVILFDRATVRYRANPPRVFGRPLLFLSRFEPDRH